MIEEFLFHPLFSEKGGFLWCAISWDIWGERNDYG